MDEIIRRWEKSLQAFQVANATFTHYDNPYNRSTENWEQALDGWREWLDNTAQKLQIHHQLSEYALAQNTKEARTTLREAEEEVKEFLSCAEKQEAWAKSEQAYRFQDDLSVSRLLAHAAVTANMKAEPLPPEETPLPSFDNYVRDHQNWDTAQPKPPSTQTAYVDSD